MCQQRAGGPAQRHESQSVQVSKCTKIISTSPQVQLSCTHPEAECSSEGEVCTSLLPPGGKTLLWGSLHQIPVCKNPTHRLEAQNCQHGDEFYDVNFKSQFNLVLTLVRHRHCHKMTQTFYLAHEFRKTSRHKLLTQQHDIFSSLWNYTFKNSKRDAKAPTPESP